jgi:hypothetical protein
VAPQIKRNFGITRKLIDFSQVGELIFLWVQFFAMLINGTEAIGIREALIDGRKANGLGCADWCNTTAIT